MITEYLLILLSLMVIIGFICLLYATGIFKRRVLVTIVENLPIGLFKENKSKIQELTAETYIQETSQSDENKLMKCTENIESKSNHDLKNEFTLESLDILKEIDVQAKDIVYWTPQGKHYHKTQNCIALQRSKVIHSGSVDESGKLTGCHKCSKF